MGKAKDFESRFEIHFSVRLRYSIEVLFSAAGTVDQPSRSLGLLTALLLRSDRRCRPEHRKPSELARRCAMPSATCATRRCGCRS